MLSEMIKHQKAYTQKASGFPLTLEEACADWHVATMPDGTKIMVSQSGIAAYSKLKEEGGCMKRFFSQALRRLHDDYKNGETKQTHQIGNRYEGKMGVPNARGDEGMKPILTSGGKISVYETRVTKWVVDDKVEIKNRIGVDLDSPSTKKQVHRFYENWGVRKSTDVEAFIGERHLIIDLKTSGALVGNKNNSKRWQNYAFYYDPTDEGHRNHVSRSPYIRRQSLHYFFCTMIEYDFKKPIEEIEFWYFVRSTSIDAKVPTKIFKCNVTEYDLIRHACLIKEMHKSIQEIIDNEISAKITPSFHNCKGCPVKCGSKVKQEEIHIISYNWE